MLQVKVFMLTGSRTQITIITSPAGSVSMVQIGRKLPYALEGPTDWRIKLWQPDLPDLRQRFTISRSIFRGWQNRQIRARRKSPPNLICSSNGMLSSVQTHSTPAQIYCTIIYADTQVHTNASMSTQTCEIGGSYRCVCVPHHTFITTNLICGDYRVLASTPSFHLPPITLVILLCALSCRYLSLSLRT